MAKSRLNNFLQAVNDYTNVRRKTRAMQGRYRTEPKFRPFDSETRETERALERRDSLYYWNDGRDFAQEYRDLYNTPIRFVPTRGDHGSLSRYNKLFEITDAAKKSVSRYNNRQIRRNSNFKPVDFQDVYHGNTRRPQTKRGTLDTVMDVFNYYPNIDMPPNRARIHTSFTPNSLAASPRRLMNEKRVAQRYENAANVRANLYRAKETAMKLAPWLGAAVGSATAVNAMRNKQSGGGSPTNKRMSKRQAGPKPNKYF
ncbi:MAG: hypothetical protein ACK5XN_25935 [Bacteroidota bacterium]